VTIACVSPRARTGVLRWRTDVNNIGDDGDRRWSRRVPASEAARHDVRASR